MEVQDLGREDPADAEHRDEREERRHERDAADREVDVERVEEPAEDVVQQDRDQEQAAADERGEDEHEVLDRNGDRRHAIPSAANAGARLLLTPDRGPRRARWRDSRIRRGGSPGRGGRAAAASRRAEQHVEPGLQRRRSSGSRAEPDRRRPGRVGRQLRRPGGERERDLALAAEAERAGLLGDEPRVLDVRQVLLERRTSAAARRSPRAKSRRGRRGRGSPTWRRKLIARTRPPSEAPAAVHDAPPREARHRERGEVGAVRRGSGGGGRGSASRRASARRRASLGVGADRRRSAAAVVHGSAGERSYRADCPVNSVARS